MYCKKQNVDRSGLFYNNNNYLPRLVCEVVIVSCLDISSTLLGKEAMEEKQ